MVPELRVLSEHRPLQSRLKSILRARSASTRDHPDSLLREFYCCPFAFQSSRNFFKPASVSGCLKSDWNTP